MLLTSILYNTKFNEFYSIRFLLYARIRQPDPTYFMATYKSKKKVFVFDEEFEFFGARSKQVGVRLERLVKNNNHPKQERRGYLIAAKEYSGDMPNVMQIYKEQADELYRMKDLSPNQLTTLPTHSVYSKEKIQKEKEREPPLVLPRNIYGL